MYIPETPDLTLAHLIIAAIGIFISLALYIGFFTGRYIIFAGSIILSGFTLLFSLSVYRLTQWYLEQDELPPVYLDIALSSGFLVCVLFPLGAIGLIHLREKVNRKTTHTKP